MNRNQAGFLAIGVLLVAIAIVLVGGFFDRKAPAPEMAGATAETPATAPSRAGQPPTEQAANDAASGAAAPSDSASSDQVVDKPQAPATEKTTAAQPSGNAPGQAAGQKTAAGAPPDATVGTDASKTPAEPSASSASPSAPDESQPAIAERSAKPVVPAFDILRVEPDGSTVIAGHAAPGATVAVMNGDQVVTKAVTGEQGDFVAVLDEPLPPGDYELKLRAETDGGAAVESEEVATVSVPKDDKGELLAMVTKPGEASRIITTPRPAKAPAASQKAPEAAVQEPDAAAPAATGASGAGTIDSAALGAPAPVTNEEARGGRPTVSSEVRVDAVEIEGDSIYVAGAAPVGSTVRVYADDKLVGEAEATEEGRFVVDAKMPLTVGEHSIRADLVDPDTGQVTVRATVPFTRPAGDQFAAVAPQHPQSEPTAPAGGAGTIDSAPSADVARLQDEANAALAELKSKASAALPNAAEIEQARQKAEQSLKDLASAPEAAGASGSAADERIRRKAGSALAKLQALPRLAKGSLPDIDAMKAMRSKLPDVEKSLKGEEPRDRQSPAMEAAAEPGEPKTVVQPALASSDDFVIIRRGDTLWQIARRVYGRGVRYTTIYLANNDQISDPDLILPGQIFDVPEKPLKNAEELHRERLREEKGARTQ